MKLTGVLRRPALPEVRQSTIFAWKFFTVLMVLCYLDYLLLQMPIMKHLISVTKTNPLLIPIVGIAVAGVVGSILVAINTFKEARIVEILVANQGSVDFLKSKLPAGEKFKNSLFVKHFRKFSTSERNHWPDEAKGNLESYLENMIMKSIDLLSSTQIVLPLLGLLGTALGISEATLGKGNNAAMFVGVGNAIGTTAIAVVGNLNIFALNYILKSERDSLLETVLVIFRIAQPQKEAICEEKKEME